MAILSVANGCGGKRMGPPLAETPPPSWESLVRNANAALESQNYPEAIRWLEQSLTLQPENASVLFKLGELYDALGQRERARERFAAGLRFGESVVARNFLAYLDIEEGEYRAAQVHVNKALELDPSNLYAKALRGICSLHLGDPRRAVEVLESVRQADKEGTYAKTTHYDYYLGLAYRELKAFDQAVEALQRAQAQSPSDPVPLLRLGEIYEANRNWEAARDVYERAYALVPNDKGLRDKIREMTANANAPEAPEEEDSGEPVPPVRILPDDISERILASPNADEMPDADAVILLNRSEHEILRDGRSRFSTHQLIKILHRRAIADYGEVAIPFNSTTQNIGVNVARTILEDGSVVEVPESAFHDVTPPESLTFNLYSDTLWKVISFSALDEGVIIEYQVTVEDAYGRGNTDNVWFWGSMSFQNKYPTLKSQYALRVPEGVTFRSKSYSCDVQPVLVSDPQLTTPGTQTYLWEYGETPGYVVEPNGPPLEAFVPRMAFSSVKTWDALHDWYRDLLREKAILDDAIAEQIGELTAEATTAEERIRALAYFVATECRYVAIQLGQGAYQPHSASEVLRNRYGDCKDKVTLLLTMLRAMGVDAYPALIQPAPEQDVDRELPSLAQFSHMILAIPNADGSFQWFDPSNTFVPFGELSARNQGRTALLITPNGPLWTTTPTSSSDDNLYEWQVELELQNDGGVKGRERLTATGTHASDIRAAYQPLSERALRDALANALAPTYPGVDIERFVVSPMLDLETPVTIDVTFSAESYGYEAGRFRFIPIPDAELDSYISLGVSRTRAQPLDLNVPNRLHQLVTFRLPEGYRVVDVPRPLVLEVPFASFRREYRVDADRVEYLLVLEIRARQVSPNEYPLAERLFELLAAESKAMIALEKIPSTPSPLGTAVETPETPYRIEPLAEAPPSDEHAESTRVETLLTSPLAPPPERSPVVPQPVEVPPSERLSPPDDRDLQAVRERIETWRQAWEKKDREGCLAFYADGSPIRRYRTARENVPVGYWGFDWTVSDKKALEESIVELFARYGRIRLAIENLRLYPSTSNAGEIVAEFTQRFNGWAAVSSTEGEPPPYSETVRKLVSFRRFDGEWRIASEIGIPLSDADEGALALLLRTAGGSDASDLQPASEWIRVAWLKRLDAWREAWVARDIAAYVALYAPRARILRSLYNEAGQLLWREMNRNTFGRYLAAVAKKYARYEVEVVNPQVYQNAAKPTVVEVRFEQRFRGWKDASASEPSYMDRGIKTLRYASIGTRWLIVEETWTPILEPSLSSLAEK